MNRLVVLGALVPALMTTTALAESSLTGTAGIIGFSLPGFETGYFEGTDESFQYGLIVGGNYTTQIGEHEDWDVLLSLSAFGAFAGSSSTSTETFDGTGVVIVQGLTTPGDFDIDIDTGGSTSDVVVSTINPQLDPSYGFDDDATGATNNIGEVVPSASESSFVVGALTTGAAQSAGYAGIGDTSGGIFVAAGDIDGLEIETTVTRQLIYVGADLTLALAGELNGDASATVYAGPSFRGLNQSTTTDVNINIAEIAPSDVTLPEFSISRSDDIDSHYFGGVLGGNVSFVGAENMIFTLGLEGGVYSVHANWTGQDTYSTCCGNSEIGEPSPEYTVEADELTYDFDSEIAFAARGSAAVTWALDVDKAFTLGASAEYLSKVATVGHSGLTTVTDGAEDISISEGDVVPGTTEFGWGHMINFALTASLTGSF